VVCARSVWRSSGGARRLRGGGRGWGQRGQSALLHRDLHSQPTRHFSPCNCVGARTFRPPGQRNSLRPFLVPSRSLPFTWQRGPRWAPQRAPQRVPEPPLGRRPSGRRPSGRGRGRGRGRGQAPPPWEPPATNERSSGLFPAYSRDTGRGSSREGEGRGRPAFDRSGVCGARARRAPGTPPGGGAGAEGAGGATFLASFLGASALGAGGAGWTLASFFSFSATALPARAPAVTGQLAGRWGLLQRAVGNARPRDSSRGARCPGSAQRARPRAGGSLGYSLGLVGDLLRRLLNLTLGLVCLLLIPLDLHARAFAAAQHQPFRARKKGRERGHRRRGSGAAGPHGP
jgi:hypothetical protein